MPRVQLTQHLHRFFPDLGERELVVDGATIADVVREVDRLAPGLGFYVCDERGRLRQHVNIFIENERVSDRQRLSDPVAPDSRVFILQALSGG